MKIYYDNLECLELKGVYLIRNLENRLLKIGICSNLKERYKSIKKQFSFCGTDPNLKIECFIEYGYNRELEAYLHKTFDNIRYKNEWFDIENIDIILNAIKNFKEPIKNIKKKRLINKKDPLLNNNTTYYNFHFKIDGEMHRIVMKSKDDFRKTVYKMNRLCRDVGYKYDVFDECLASFDCNNEDDREEFEEINLNYIKPITDDIIKVFKDLNCDYIILSNNEWIDLEVFVVKRLNYIRLEAINALKEELNLLEESLNYSSIEGVKRDIDKFKTSVINDFF